MCSRIKSCVPSDEPVSTITHDVMYGATASSTSRTMCDSLRTIMLRQIDGRADAGSHTQRSHHGVVVVGANFRRRQPWSVIPAVDRSSAHPGLLNEIDRLATAEIEVDVNAGLPSRQAWARGSAPTTSAIQSAQQSVVEARREQLRFERCLSEEFA